MKKIVHMALIAIMSVVIVEVMSFIDLSYYDIQTNIVESSNFRKLNIDKKSFTNAEKLSKENNVDLSGVLSAFYLKENMVLKRQKFSAKEYKVTNKNYLNADKKEYLKVRKAMAAVLDDLKYFPVAKSSSSDYWVNYEDSFGADRNYNGAYKHEGTDIMAQNNISGYYPVVSMTDGVIENIGWLEKGGYRVGVRSNSGGYFYYAHLSSYSNIKKGDEIKAGTLLGYMGDTGYGKEEGTSGNFDVHLHLGIYIKTENFEELSLNPYHVLKWLEDKLIIANY